MTPAPIDAKTLAAAAEAGVRLEIMSSPSFSLSQGVKDVAVFEPSSLLVLHVRKGGVRRYIAPTRIALECGCELEV